MQRNGCPKGSLRFALRIGNCAACYRIEKRGIQKIAGQGAAKIRGAGRSAGKGAARGVFLGKESGAAPSPALPPAPRILP